MTPDAIISLIFGFMLGVLCTITVAALRSRTPPEPFRVTEDHLNGTKLPTVGSFVTMGDGKATRVTRVLPRGQDWGHDKADGSRHTTASGPAICIGADTWLSPKSFWAALATINGRPVEMTPKEQP